jgi:hypothetical protein
VRWAVAALLLLCATVGPAQAQSDLSAADRASIQGVITRQIEAFRHDDSEAAFGFASPGIQGQFGTPGRFLDMVRRVYPAVHRPRTVEFTGLRLGEGVVQEVELVGPDGTLELALYAMERDSAGAWRIAGCTLVPSARIGT